MGWQEKTAINLPPQAFIPQDDVKYDTVALGHKPEM